MDSGASPKVTVIKSQASSGSGGGNQSNDRELIWKTAEGTEKRLVLPIEMIKEDVMDDPERLLESVD